MRERTRQLSMTIKATFLAASLGLSGCGQESIDGLLGSGADAPEIPVASNSDDPFLKAKA